jgi:hypothetical protein
MEMMLGRTVEGFRTQLQLIKISSATGHLCLPYSKLSVSFIKDHDTHWFVYSGSTCHTIWANEEVLHNTSPKHICLHALCDVAAQFNLDSGGISAQATPQWRTAAICAAATDLNLTCDQQLQVLHLFCDNIAAADAYLAIDDAELHTEFILGAL